MSAPAAVLPLLKPPGPSSHQVVQAVRRRLGAGLRVGHAGTLDPAAAGVLPLCIGAATRLTAYLQIPSKAYRFELVLGQETDTQDATGRVLGRADARGITRTAIEGVMCALVGDVRQMVPLYSARRLGGRRLYEYARSGVAASLPEISVRIEHLALVDWRPGNPARGLCDVRCSSGTYVRALCADIGRRLGVGAYMGHLVRYAAGGLDATVCVTLEEWEAAVREGRWRERCISPAAALGFLPAVTADPVEVEAVAHGRPPGRRRAGAGEEPGLVRILAGDGRLLAVARRTVEDGVTGFILERVLV